MRTVPEPTPTMRHRLLRAPSLARIPARIPARIALAALALFVASCGSDPTGTRIPEDISKLFWALQANHQAVTLSVAAPYSTIQLTATPLSHTGAPLAGLAAASWKSLSPTVVGIDAQGVVTARAPGFGSIVATLQADDVTHTDTIAVSVTSKVAASPLDTLDIAPPDVVTVGIYASFFPQTMQPRTVDADGNPMSSVAVHFESLDPTLLRVDRQTGALDPVRPGQAKIAATATAYGVTRSDTALVTVIPPLMQIVLTPVQITADGRQVRTFDPGTVTLVRGGSISWINGTLIDNPETPLDITFDDASKAAMDQLLCFCGTGNIAPFVTPPFGWFTSMRSFPETGTYTYHSAALGISGTIIVVDP